MHRPHPWWEREGTPLDQSSSKLGHRAETARLPTAPHTYRYLPLFSHTQALETPSHSLTTWADQDNKKSPWVFLYLGREGSSLPPGTGSGTGSGAGWTSTRAGRRGTASSPLLLAVCRQIGLGHIGNQGTRIHSPFQGLIHLKLCFKNLHKQRYYAILCYAALTSTTL